MKNKNRFVETKKKKKSFSDFMVEFGVIIALLAGLFFIKIKQDRPTQGCVMTPHSIYDLVFHSNQVKMDYHQSMIDAHPRIQNAGGHLVLASSDRYYEDLIVYNKKNKEVLFKTTSGKIFFNQNQDTLLKIPIKKDFLWGGVEVYLFRNGKRILSGEKIITFYPCNKGSQFVAIVEEYRGKIRKILLDERFRLIVEKNLFKTV